MEKEISQIISIPIAAIAVVIVMAFVVIDIILIYKNKKLIYLSELKTLKSNYETEVLKTRSEAHQIALNEIAGELHDNVGKTLSLAVIYLNQVDIDESLLTKSQLIDIRDTIRQAMQELRQLSHNISSLNINLVEEINKTKERLDRTNSIIFQHNLFFDKVEISKEKELILLRVIQELIQNTIKHANATNIILNITQLSAHLLVVYKDDGKGFNYETSILQSGLGLKSIKTRMQILDAKWDLISSPGMGTILQAEIPLNILLEENGQN